VVDWPITYDDLEPYYAEVERVVGVSGRVVPHPFLEPALDPPDFPYPAHRPNIRSPPGSTPPAAAWATALCHCRGRSCRSPK